jgi:hypothetical protein
LRVEGLRVGVLFFGNRRGLVLAVAIRRSRFLSCLGCERVVGRDE